MYTMNTRIYVNRKLPTMMDSDEIKVSLRKYRDNSGTKAISSGLNTLKSLSLSLSPNYLLQKLEKLKPQKCVKNTSFFRPPIKNYN